jgi:two-component SAPR family response regulator
MIDPDQNGSDPPRTAAKGCVFMQPVNGDIPQIEVQMFGEFSITINGNTLTNLTGRTKRVWLLIQYLIANRFKDVTTDMLQEVLWKEGECGDPLNSLKNLVYRAREILKKLSGCPNATFIQFVDGRYQWNNHYPCIVDSEQLVKCWKIVKDSSLSDEDRVRSCSTVLSLYRGEFLPKSSYCTWAVLMAREYEARYIDCILNVCILLIKMNLYDEVISVCKTALKIAPLEESIHKMLLYAYISTNRRDEALEHYTHAAELFYQEFGINISETLLPVYKQMLNSISHIESDLNDIKNDLQEHSQAEGAFFCDYDVFKAIYRIQARSMERTGISIYLVLFTLNDLNGAYLDDNTARIAGAKLKEAIICSLRKGDAVTAYSATQFLVMLPVINYENVQNVANRILRKFRFLYRKNNIPVVTSIKPMDPVK